MSVLASRQSGRQNAVCNMSGMPEPGNGAEETARKKPSWMMKQHRAVTQSSADERSLLTYQINDWVLVFPSIVATL